MGGGGGRDRDRGTYLPVVSFLPPWPYPNCNSVPAISACTACMQHAFWPCLAPLYVLLPQPLCDTFCALCLPSCLACCATYLPALLPASMACLVHPIPFALLSTEEWGRLPPSLPLCNTPTFYLFPFPSGTGCGCFGLPAFFCACLH